jgi:hypothetical protein
VLWPVEALAVVPEPLMPIVDTRPAATIAAIVARRMRFGVSHGTGWVCIQLLNPVAADAAAIAQPAHMPGC